MVDSKQLFDIVILVLLAVAVTPTILTGVSALNFDAFTVLAGMKDIIIILFIVGVYVYGVGKKTGMVK